jgi:hypothetical protein
MPEHPSAAYRTVIGPPAQAPGRRRQRDCGRDWRRQRIDDGEVHEADRDYGAPLTPCSTIHANDHHLRFAASIHAFRPDLLGFFPSFPDPRNVVGAKRFIYLRLGDQHYSQRAALTTCKLYESVVYQISNYKFASAWLVLSKRDTNKAAHFIDRIFNND